MPETAPLEASGANAADIPKASSQRLAESSPQLPGKRLLVLATAAMVLGLVSALVMTVMPAPMPFFGIGLAFFAGGLAVWRLMADDQSRAVAAVSERDEKITHLLRRCEILEDRNWELRESDERHGTILKTLGDLVIHRDAGCNVLYANEAAVTVLADEGAPVVGQPMTLPSGPDPASRPFGLGDLRLQTVDGPRWYSRIDTMIRDKDAGGPVSQTVLRDVTDRRAIEEELLAARHTAESSNEAKSRFLATVSHEIRTPLNGILGMAALLRDTRLTKEQSAYVEALESSGEILLLLIDEVLDFSKVEAGKLDIQPRSTPLAALTENVVELLAPRAHAKNLEIASRLAPDLPESVTLDATRVRQILFNLAGNGIKFTDEGGVAIEVDGRAKEGGGCWLDIVVRDTGIGFSAEETGRLFKEFEQVDHGPARKFGGTGLGLAIAQRLVGLMSGSIEAAAKEGEGACFMVSLPVPEPLQGCVSRRRVYSGKTVVILSNGLIEGALLGKRLTAQGARVHFRAPGDPQLSEDLQSADLIILDNSALADAGGWLVAARLAGCTAKAIVLVAPSERDRLDRLRDAGYAAYLIRPVRMETLGQVIDGLFDPSGVAEPWQAGEVVQAANPTGAASARVRPMRLLVAEDNDINRLLSEALLRKLGHEPVLVVDGEKAVNAAAREDFDAILMDLHMPGLDGIGAIRQIRERERAGGQPSVPILIVTADVMEDSRARAEEVGANGYLTKPLSIQAIAQALDTIDRDRVITPHKSLAGASHWQ